MSGSSRGGVSVVITAIDRASRQIDAINRRLRAMQAPIVRLQRSLTRFGDLSGLTKLGNAFQGLARFALRAFMAVSSILAPLAAITGALSVAGLARLVTSFGDLGTKILLTSQRLGIMPQQLQIMQGAAQFAGTSADAFTNGMKTLGGTLVDMVAGRAPEAVMMMTTLGLSLRDSTGHARKATDVLPELANKIAAIKDPFLQARVAAVMFGGAAEEMLPFLRSGAAGIAEWTAMSAKYGTIADEDLNRFNDLRKSQVALSIATRALSSDIAAALAPSLQQASYFMADWLAANRQWLRSTIEAKVKELSDYLKTIDWKGDAKEIKDFAVEVNGVAQALGGWKPIIEGIIALKFLGWVVALIKPLAQLIGLMSLIPGSGVAAGAAAMLGAGAAAGAMNMPVTDEFGRVIPTGGWGGQDTSGNPAAGTRQPFSWPTGPDWSRGLTNRPVGATLGMGGPVPPPPTKAEALANEKESWDYWISRGYSPEQAAGLIANEQVESGFNPHPKPGDGGIAVGSYQWHPDRRANILSGTGIDVANASHLENLKGLDWEISFGSERARAGRLRQAKSPYEAGYDTSMDVIRPGNGPAQADLRGRLAEDIYKRHLADAQQKAAALPAPPVAPGPPIPAAANDRSSNDNQPVSLGGRDDQWIANANDMQVDQPGGAPVNVGGGTGDGLSKSALEVNGTANLNVRMTGAPPGTTAAVTTEGDLWGGQSRVVNSLPGYGP